jgi:hypothetical protein
MKDLVILVADKNMEYAMRGGLSRNRSLKIRQIEPDIKVHPNRDGGVRTTGSQLLRSYAKTHQHALLLMDFEGCGVEAEGVDTIERGLDERLAQNWGDRAKAIVIAPELEVWMWGGDNSIEQKIGWNQDVHIRDWLRTKGYVLSSSGKPERPKEAFELVLRVCKQPRSSDWYETVAKSISMEKCADAKFAQLRDILQRWFPPSVA